MAGEMHAGFVDHTLVHRRRRHRGKLARLATGQRPVKQRQHISPVGRIELTGDRRTGQRQVQDIEYRATSGNGRITAVDRSRRLKIAEFDIQAQSLGARFEQAAVTEHHRMRLTGISRQLQTKLRSDASRLAAGHRDQWAHYFSSSRFST